MEPFLHRVAHPVARPGRCDRPGLATFAGFVGVALAAPGPRSGRHSLDTLPGSAASPRAPSPPLRASEPAGDLGDREALLVAVVVRDCDRPTALLDAVQSHHASDDTTDRRRQKDVLPLMLVSNVGSSFERMLVRCRGGGAAPPVVDQPAPGVQVGDPFHAAGEFDEPVGAAQLREREVVRVVGERVGGLEVVGGGVSVHRAEHPCEQHRAEAAPVRVGGASTSSSSAISRW